MPTSRVPIATVLAGSVIRQSLVPMAVFYLIFMGALGLGLYHLQRHAEPGTRGRARPPRRTTAAPGEARGWPALIQRVARVAIPGYLLLLAVDFTYYFGIAKVGGDFLLSAVTGPALLLGLSMPTFALVAWLLQQWAHRRGVNHEPPAPRSGGPAGPPDSPETGDVLPHRPTGEG